MTKSKTVLNYVEEESKPISRQNLRASWLVWILTVVARNRSQNCTKLDELLLINLTLGEKEDTING